jgi:hypothetical protein
MHLAHLFALGALSLLGTTFSQVDPVRTSFAAPPTPREWAGVYSGLTEAGSPCEIEVVLGTSGNLDLHYRDPSGSWRPYWNLGSMLPKEIGHGPLHVSIPLRGMGFPASEIDFTISQGGELRGFKSETVAFSGLRSSLSCQGLARR